MTHLVRIGNSLGVRIPKAIITQVGINEEMKLVFTVTEGGLLISPEKKVREGWKEKFSKDKKNPLLLGDFKNEFDEDEWEW